MVCLLDVATSTVVGLAAADEQLALLPLANSMLVNNVDLAALSVDVLHALVHN